MGYRSDILSVRGIGTHLMRGGRGRPVLVFHPEFGADLWAPYHDRLAGHFQVFAPDHPGFGRSERPDWLDHVDDLVYHYVDLLDLLGLQRVALVGTSFGGWIAAALAVAHPERVERMVLAAPAGIRVDGAVRYDLFANPLDNILRCLFHDPARIPQILPVESGPDTLLRTYRESTTLARLIWDPYLYDPKLQQRLPRVAAPTLIVWGENDAILGRQHADAFAALIPNARTEFIAACGHLVPLEHAERFSQLAIDFIGGGA